MGQVRGGTEQQPPLLTAPLKEAELLGCISAEG